MKTKRLLLVSSSVILLCMCIVVGMSYGLFTESISVKNHLQAGKLDATLTRTNLEYRILNNDGELETKTAGVLDLTSSTAENAFGINSSDIKIVPGSYFNAGLKIANNGNVAFDYSVKIDLLGTSNELAQQLEVTVTLGEQSVTKKLSEFANGLSISTGSIKPGGAPQTFNVKVTFVDNANNNAAQTQTAEFDLIVTAEQSTR